MQEILCDLIKKKASRKGNNSLYIVDVGHAKQRQNHNIIVSVVGENHATLFKIFFLNKKREWYPLEIEEADHGPSQPKGIII